MEISRGSRIHILHTVSATIMPINPRKGTYVVITFMKYDVYSQRIFDLNANVRWLILANFFFFFFFLFFFFPFFFFSFFFSYFLFFFFFNFCFNLFPHKPPKSRSAPKIHFNVCYNLASEVLFQI